MMDQKPWSLDDFDIQRRIGYGMCAKVFLVRRKLAYKNDSDDTDSDNEDTVNKPDNPRLALKMVKLNKRAYTEDVLTERQILPDLTGSPFIVQLHFAFLVPESHLACLVLSLGEGGDLFSLHEREYSMLEAEAKFYLAELICALEYLHDRNICHRDIKTENVVLDAEGHVQLCDFGVAKLLKDGKKAHTFVGTLLYMAPEVAKRQPYNHKCDIWGLGILFCYLVSGREPILGDTDEERLVRIKQGKYVIGYESSLSPNCKKLIKEMLLKDPVSRPECRQLRERKFLNKLDWDKVCTRGLKPPYHPSLDDNQRSHVAGGGDSHPNSFNSARRVRESYGARDENGEAVAGPAEFLKMLTNFEWPVITEDIDETER